jgi:hypothetical protein
LKKKNGSFDSHFWQDQLELALLADRFRHPRVPFIFQHFSSRPQSPAIHV